VHEEWVEASLLPTSTRNAYFEDILLDSLLACVGESPLLSLQDAERYVSSKLSLWVEIKMSAVVTDVIKRLALRILLHKESPNLKQDSKIGKLLKLANKSLTLKSPLVTQSYIGTKSSLVLTFPDFDEDDDNTAKAVSHLISLACSLHSTKPEFVAIHKDKTYGEGRITMSASLLKLTDALTSSALHPQGLFIGDVYNFNSGFKGTLVSMMAAMRLLNTKSEFVRRRKFSRESKKSPTSFNTLQETFNTMSGLKSDTSLPFTQNFVKAVLSSSVKAHNKGFPGGWIHASRSVNGVKSDFALINLLGWTEKVPSQHKMLEVLFNTVDPPSETTGLKKDTVVNITRDKRNFSHREFRTAVALSLPRIQIKNKDPKGDLSLDPFSVRTLTIPNNFCSDGRETLVDRLNESYGLRVSLKNPKSKTREIHYKNSRDRLLGESANIPLKTGDGLSFETFSDLPKPLQKFFRDTFRYPVKRKRDGEHPSDDTPITDVVEMTVDSISPPKRRRKVTRGQAAAEARMSGRLATLRSQSKNS